MDPAQVTKAFQAVARSSGQMSPEQYFRISLAIPHMGPANVLVFGAGLDTEFYLSLNPEGFTLVLESDPVWLQKVTGLGSDWHYRAVQTNYTTRIGDGLLGDCPKLTDLPPVVSSQWDVIIVDGPVGWPENPDNPGRQQSIMTAAELRDPETIVFVHDWNREFERQCARRYLGEPVEVVRSDQTELAVFQEIT